MNLIGREESTICAPITATYQSGVSVVRISGLKALEHGRQLLPFLPREPESHRIYYGFAVDPKSAEPIDEVLVSYFQKGKSFTGEETLEVSCHGNPLIVAKIMETLVASGCLPAERGEFTFRAFHHGRIDLVQAEAVLSLIEGQSVRATQLAMRQLKGELSRKLSAIEDHLTWCLANIEAGIDFTTEDIDVLEYQEIKNRAGLVCSEIERLVSSYHENRPAREGLRVAIIGLPNSGKSSLMNALLEQQRAIVTEIPGTTRDVIEAELALGNGKVILLDTAGLRETQDRVEQIGIQKAREEATEADLILYLVDSTVGLTAEDRKELAGLKNPMLVLTKSDLVSGTSETNLSDAISISSKNEAGLAELKAVFQKELSKGLTEEGAVIIQKRHYSILLNVKARALAALKLLESKASLEFVALELQESLSGIFEILGKRLDDQVMDRVFKEFCIGK